MWVAPSGVPVPEEAAGAIRLEVSAEDDSGRRLLSESWPLERTADAYLKFMKTFEPLRAWIERREQLTDADAFTARVLLIHHYRRVVLRDPLLPVALLPADWPGRAARTLCGEIYRALLPASEQWLDRHANERKRAVAEGRRGTGAAVRRLVNVLQKYIAFLYFCYILIPINSGRSAMYTQALNTSDGGDRGLEDAARAAQLSRRASMPTSASSRTTGCRPPIARR